MLSDPYRQSATTSGTRKERTRVAVANPGFIGGGGRKTRGKPWTQVTSLVTVEPAKTTPAIPTETGPDTTADPATQGANR